jgi:hypothetical protein
MGEHLDYHTYKRYVYVLSQSKRPLEIVVFWWYNELMKSPKPISIMLYEDDLPELREIRCVHCSRMLCKINADVKSIVFGDGFDPEQHHEMVSGMKVMEHKCRGCDCVYKFLFQK